MTSCMCPLARRGGRARDNQLADTTPSDHALTLGIRLILTFLIRLSV
jgi:hypothetical protein